MFDFNFLTRKRQKEYRAWVLLNHASTGLFLVALLLIAITAVIVIGRYSADSLVDAANAESVSLQEAQKQLSSSEAAETQRSLQQLETIQKAHSLFLDDLSQLYNTAGPGITLSNVDIDYAAGEVHVAGIADTRSTFIQFQTALDSIESLTLSEVPLDLLAQPEDIIFRLSLLLEE